MVVCVIAVLADQIAVSVVNAEQPALGIVMQALAVFVVQQVTVCIVIQVADRWVGRVAVGNADQLARIIRGKSALGIIATTVCKCCVHRSHIVQRVEAKYLFANRIAVAIFGQVCAFAVVLHHASAFIVDKGFQQLCLVIELQVTALQFAIDSICLGDGLCGVACAQGHLSDSFPALVVVSQFGY